MSKLEIKDGKFVYDEENITIISGAIHYFRVVPEYWRDRLLKLKAAGFNTVETYVAWNVHEPKPGEFVFEGMADICRFIETAAELGLHVIVRPGPYICAEWEFGGFPAWLLNAYGLELRCYNEPYLSKVDGFFNELIPRLLPYMCTNGGPIIAMQVENEYGSYGNDKRYLKYIKEGIINRGIDVLLFTSDGPTDMMLTGGTIDGVLKTVNFGSNPMDNFNKLREYEKENPIMCMEYWNGWFDQWELPHHTRSAKEVAQDADKMLDMGASFNMYMFHGGTNFGFMNGANYYDKYCPTITSYDYDSILSETGDYTEKYHLVREVIMKHLGVVDVELPAETKKQAYGKVKLSMQAKLKDNLLNLSQKLECVHTLSMEKLNQNYGYVLYRTSIPYVNFERRIKIVECHDRAQVFLNDKPIGVLDRNNPENMLKLEAGGGGTLDILVENMGRINYGVKINDRKGILRGVLIENQLHFGWEMYSLPMDDLSRLHFDKINETDCPSFYRGAFEADNDADTFLSLEGFTKGAAYINGFNLGRYWSKGPQKTLYVPGPLLRKGMNEIIVFEQHSTECLEVEFLDKHLLG